MKIYLGIMKREKVFNEIVMLKLFRMDKEEFYVQILEIFSER